MTGMPSLRASPTAMCSLLVSTTQTADGTLAMSRIPPRLRSSLFFSRVRIKISFFARRQRFVQGGEVGQHAPQPALVDVRHADSDRLGRDGFLRLFLGTDEQH